MNPFLTLALAFVAVLNLQAATGIATLRNPTGSFEIDSTGAFTAIASTDPSINLLAPNQPAPVLQIRIQGKWYSPSRASWNPTSSRLTLSYPEAHATASVSIVSKPTHITLELIDAVPITDIELALWGPYPLTIHQTIGEIVGVVRDQSLAVGIQALNPKTLGGFPTQENDADSEFGADDSGLYPHLPNELLKGQGFRGDTARKTSFGSVLQGYSRNRSSERFLPNWGHDRYRVLPYADGGIKGSRIALFVCPEPKALHTIGAIELAEGLPHPLIDGQWAKTSPLASASYLIVDFSESTVDRAIEMTRRAGLRYLYHSSPFSKWGHFELKPNLFPNGWNGFRTCVEKAERAGVKIGFHTLSNFITPSDAYITPTPDPRLATIGSTTLSEATDPSQSTITIADPALFTRKSALNTARIGNELIRFSAVSSNPPWRLLDCERGAWGTTASAHPKNAELARLLDHEYKVFFSDASLSLEIARNIANFCNHTGARQLSFDGLEGNWASGYGQYGRTLFTHAWYEALNSNARGTVINDASNPGHFNWHINTRMNWGEPWYAGFRESQTLYRFKNQVLFERNFMPHMLGWFALRADTSIEDAEWLLARAAGFDAGFALATSLASTAQLAADPSSADTARQFGATSAILALIHHWESARMAGAFTPEAKAKLRDNQREFHLQTNGPAAWTLQEVFVTRWVHPGNTNTPTRLVFQNPTDPQPLRWILRSTSKSPTPNVSLKVGPHAVLDLGNQTIPPGGSIRFDGASEAIVSDASWKEQFRLPIHSQNLIVGSAPVTIEASAQLPADATLKIELRTLGPATRLNH